MEPHSFSSSEKEKMANAVCSSIILVELGTGMCLTQLTHVATVLTSKCGRVRLVQHFIAQRKSDAFFVEGRSVP